MDEIKKPDYHTHEEFQNRSTKLAELRKAGIDPYPAQFIKEQEIHDLTKDWADQNPGNSEDAAEGKSACVTTAGRLLLFRSMGKNAFGQIQNEHERIQVMFNRDQTAVTGLQEKPEEVTEWKWFEKKLDLGDIIGVKGHLFRTNKGELTIFVKEVTLLCKTLLPLADKHSGLHDKETRYRKRWLDLISNADTHKTFAARSKILHEVRGMLFDKGFAEVETPVLQSIYGGAEAKPFETKLHAMDQEMFLRISLEIPLKKLIIGGMPKVFEIGRVFRNEGIDRNHNPEFTLLEIYAAYWDYKDMMQLVENLFEKLAISLHGTSKIPATLSNGEEISLDLQAPWPRLTMKEAVKKFADIDIDSLSTEEMKKRLHESGHVADEKLPAMNRGLCIAAYFEVFAESHLIQPHHIIDHPIETTPLCKPHREEKEKAEGLVERFESFILGSEICNAYSELNDPELQRDLLEQQAMRREGGDEEASPLDEEFIESICQGMPPTAGIGIGIDRMIMILLNSHTIRDILLFPWMKPEHQTESETE